MGKLLAFVGMIFAILGQTGNMVIAKVAMSDGINKYVMIFYTYALSSIFLFPFSFFLLHRSQCPPLTFSFLCKFFLLALFGWSSHTLSYVGIDLSSPTLATALLNLIPAFTFLLALIFRMEVLDYREHSSQAKLVGTIVSIGGAFIVIFYKGPSIFNTTHSSLSSININLSSPQSNWVLGGFYCAIDSLMTSLWYIYQASIIKKYPAVMVVVFFQIFFSTILSALFGLFTVRDPSAWVLRFDMGLVSIFYQGVVAIAIRYSITTWCVDKAGPLFCTMFKPLGIIFTVIMASLFLGDHFHLGSLVGSVIIVVGFYGVMWGKAEEEKKVEGGIENYESSSCHSVPLLQHKV